MVPICTHFIHQPAMLTSQTSPGSSRHDRDLSIAKWPASLAYCSSVMAATGGVCVVNKGLDSVSAF